MVTNVVDQSRRAVFRSLAAAGAIVAVPAAALAAAAPAPLSAADSRALDLWRRRQRVKRICDERSAAQDAAYTQLPEWALPGPKYLGRDGGAWGDERAGWPMVADLSRRPSMSGAVNARPSPEELFEEYRWHTRLLTDGEITDRGAPLRNFAAQLGELNDRIGQKEAEEARLGIPDLDQRLEASFAVRRAVECDLDKLMHSSALATAAVLMVEIELDNGEAGGLHHAALRALRPRLVGAIAEDADRILSQLEEALS
jgi:hypothetical protein